MWELSLLNRCLRARTGGKDTVQGGKFMNKYGNETEGSGMRKLLGSLLV